MDQSDLQVLDEQAGPLNADAIYAAMVAIRRIGPVSLDWLLGGDPARQPPSISGSKVVSFTRRRAMN